MLSKSATKTLEMLLHAFGQCSLGQTQSFEWNTHFKVSQMSVQEDECSGQPITNRMPENVKKKIHELFLYNHHQTIHHLSPINEISYGACQEILVENLNMHYIAVKCDPGF